MAKMTEQEVELLAASRIAQDELDAIGMIQRAFTVEGGDEDSV